MRAALGHDQGLVEGTRTGGGVLGRHRLLSATWVSPSLASSSGKPAARSSGLVVICIKCGCYADLGGSTANPRGLLEDCAGDTRVPGRSQRLQRFRAQRHPYRSRVTLGPATDPPGWAIRWLGNKGTRGHPPNFSASLPGSSDDTAKTQMLAPRPVGAASTGESLHQLLSCYGLGLPDARSLGNREVERKLAKAKAKASGPGDDPTDENDEGEEQGVF